MKAFAKLYLDLDGSTSTQRKCGHIVHFLKSASHADAAWAIFFLIGGRIRRTVSTALMRRAACQLAAVPDWLFEQSYQAVGDLGETISLLLPLPHTELELGLAECIEQRVLPLRGLDESDALQAVSDLWMQMQAQERFLFVKWVGGGLRVGVSRALVIRALSQLTGLDARILAQRMIAFAQVSQPQASDWISLTLPESDARSNATTDLMPYPFFLAHPLEGDVEDLGDAGDWLAEWKYDGIRAQIVKRAGAVNIWSRGEELLNDTFPELVEMAATWPDGTVMDGEILVLHPQGHDKAGQLASFASLQVRLGRKRVDAKLRQSHPVIFLAYDLLENSGMDIRPQAQWQRREKLEAVCAQCMAVSPALRLSTLLPCTDWNALKAERSRSREQGVEGLMLKARTAAYGVGRTRNEGVWLKWKIEPMSIDAVLVYAQAGHGRRASLYTDYTFAVWDRPPQAAEVAQMCRQLRDSLGEKRREGASDSASTNGSEQASGADDGPHNQKANQGPQWVDPSLPQLVTFAKAYSGLTDEEFRRVDKAIRANLLEKFGPVRRVVPSMVFELGFEGIAHSTRHKSGVAVRFPRMLRIRDDKPLEQAATLADLQALLQVRS